MTSGDDDDLIACLSGAGQRLQRSGQNGFLLVQGSRSKSVAITRVVMCYFRPMLKSDPRHDGTPPWRQDRFFFPHLP